jgi:hypothetical protein
MLRVASRQRSRYRRRWRWVRRLLLLLLLALPFAVVAIAVGAWPAVQAARDAQGQIKSLEAMRPTLEDHPSVGSLRDVDKRVRLLNDDIRIINRSWQPWKGAVLYLSRPFQSVHSALLQVDPLLAYGRQVTSAGHVLSAAFTPLVQTMGDQVSSAKVPRIVAQLASSKPALHAGSVLLRHANTTRRLISDSDLPGSVRHGLSVLDTVLPGAPDTLDSLAALSAALGADGPRNYLLVPQNNEDLRATGGFIGTVAVLHVDHGQVRLIRVASSYDVDNGKRPNVMPPTPMALYGWSSFYFRDGNWSADYPTTAQVLKILYRMGTKLKVDGVIAFNPPLVQQMLQLTGPLEIPEYHERLNAGNFFQRLDYEINVVQRTGDSKAFASAAYQTVFAHLVALNKLNGRLVLSMLSESVRARDLMFYFDDRAVQAAVHQAGADGSVRATTGDYLYVVDTNTSQQKLNGLVHETITYRATIQPDRTIDATLDLHYTNEASKSNVPPNQTPAYDEFVRVLAPQGSHLLDSSGLDARWATNTVHHKTEFSGHFSLPSRSTHTIRFHYRIPASVDSGSTYSLLVQRQPGSGNWPVNILVSGSKSVLVAGQSHLTATLSRDVAVHAFISGGAAQAGTPIPVKPDTPVVPGSQPEPWLSVPDTNTSQL